MKKRSIALLLVLSLLTAFALSACGPAAVSESPSRPPAEPSPADETSDPSPTASGEPVKIGLITILAGVEAYIGLATKMALEDYIADLNAGGGLLGRPVELIAYDYSVDPATETVAAANRFTQQDKVVGIIGPSGSSAAVPMAPIINAAKTPTIATAATNIKVTVDETTGKVYPYMFRVCFIDPYQGTALAEFAHRQGISKVASLAAIGDPYAEGLLDFFTERFTELGGEMVATLSSQRNDVEFRAQITEAKSKGAEALFMPATNYRDGGLVANQARDLGVDLQFLFGDGIYSQELLDVGGEALEGAFISVGILEDDPRFAAYQREFAEKHPGNSVNMYVLYALDAMMLLQWAIESTGSFDGEVIRDALESAVDVPCFTDTLTIDPATHNPHNKSVSILQVTGGEYKLYETFKPEG